MNTFTESQRFNQWWLWAVVVIVSFAPTGVVLTEWHKSIFDWHYLAIALFITLLLLVSFRLICLITIIDETGISYQFFLVHLRPKRISWNDIGKLYIRQYQPMEFGGRGYKSSVTRKTGTACTVAGNTGLQLVLRNGKKILIGTGKPEAINALLLQLKRLHKIPPEIFGDPDVVE